MTRNRPDLLPLICSRLIAAVGVLLLAAVALAPAAEAVVPDAIRHPVTLFARDGALRRTAAAAGVGMLVCAAVFFRRDAGPRPGQRPRDPGGAGA